MNIQAIDNELLLWVNGHHAPLFDFGMWYTSRALTWLPLYLLLIGYLAWILKGGKTLRSWLPFIAVVLAFCAAAGLADFVSSGILKPLFERPRPTHNEALAPMIRTLRGYTGGPYGFPSSHAANTASVAVLFMLLCASLKTGFSRAQLIAARLWIIVLIFGYWGKNCYSRMYLGVHYPSDLLAGSLIGALAALCAFLCWRAFYRKTNQKSSIS